MKKNGRFYRAVRKIHLYSSLLTAVFLLMYILTSYMMIYHNSFKVEKENESLINLQVIAEEVSEANWKNFLKKHQVKGRLTGATTNDSGDLVRTYSRADGNSVVTLKKNNKEVSIVTTTLNASGSIIGLHRLRGYGGSFIYNAYAFMVDTVGIALILFAATGIILWLQLLKFNKIAWVILLLGFIYVSSVIAYLSYF